MKYILLLVTASMVLAGCGGKNDTKIEKWSWLPKTAKRDAEIAQVPNGAQIYFSMGEPLESNAGSGFQFPDASHTRFIPAEKEPSSFVRGSLISKLGSVTKEAKWGDWDFVFADAAHREKAGWGHSLTSGEILLPRKVFLDPLTCPRFLYQS
jgi:hypothetical protein